MAGRVVLRATALGLAAARAGAPHAVSRWTPPRELSPFVPSVRLMLLESAQGFQASLLGARTLSGAHLRDVRARAEHDLALADVDRSEGGDPAAATDLRLLLATRDGRTADALRLYEEAARDAPFDPRPRALAYHLCLADGREDESVRWSAAYHRLVPVIEGVSGMESHETQELVCDLRYHEEGCILFRATAFGLTAVAAGALHGVSSWTPPRELCVFVPCARLMLLESTHGLQAYLRDVRARAEHDLALADVDLSEGGDAAAATDLRLLVALLATRDGRAADALRLYEEAARDAPFDPRPRALAYHLCLADGREDESVRWIAAYRRLVPVFDVPGLESDETRVLVRELLVAATLGGVCDLAHPADRAFVMRVACGLVDDGLVAALQKEALSATDRLQLRALRVYLHAKVRLLIKKEAQDMADGDASPVSCRLSEMLIRRTSGPILETDEGNGQKIKNNISLNNKAQFEGNISGGPIKANTMDSLYTLRTKRNHAREAPRMQRNVSTLRRGYCSNIGDDNSTSGNRRATPTIFDTIGPVHNTVTWNLNEAPQEGFDNCTGHQRLYHCTHGQALDVSSIFGEEKMIYTTALDGTFRFKVTFSEQDPSTGSWKDYYVELIIDAREGWNYDFSNKYGTFEYWHPYRPFYVSDSQMLDFKPDYSTNGLAPLGHGFTLMGLPAVREACKIMSEYNGRLPTSPQLRMACGIMVNYSCEAWKLHNVQHANSQSLLNGIICTLNEWDKSLSPTMKNWSQISMGELHFILHRLHSPEIPVMPRLPKVQGIQTINDACDTVAIIPYNRVPRSPKDSNTRTWTCFPLDQGPGVEEGKPHYLSRQFLCKWPFDNAVATLRPPAGFIDLSIAGPLATKVKRSNLAAVKESPQVPRVSLPVPSLLKQSELAIKILRWLRM